MYYFPGQQVFTYDKVLTIIENGREFQEQGIPILPGTSEDWNEQVMQMHYEKTKADVLIMMSDVWAIQRTPELARQGKIRWISINPLDYLDPVPRHVIDKMSCATKIVPWVWEATNRLRNTYGLNNVADPIPIGINTKLWNPLDRSAYPNTMESFHWTDDSFKILIIAANQWLRKCLLPKSKVHVLEGVKDIENVVVGDKVLTHKGRYSEVKEVSAAPYSGTIVTITPTYFNIPIQMTHDHPVLALRRKNIKNLTNHVKRRQNIKSNPEFYRDNQVEWIAASDLNVGDYVVMPRLTETHDISNITLADFLTPGSYAYNNESPMTTTETAGGNNNSQQQLRILKRGTYRLDGTQTVMKYGHLVNDRLDLDADFMRLCGYFLAEGSIIRQGISFSFHEKEVDTYVKDLGEIVREKFGVDMHWHHVSGRKSVTVAVHSGLVSQLFLKLFGTGARKKHIPFWFLALSDDKLWGLVKGMWSGDGTFSKKDQCFRYTTASADLAYQFFLILTRLGIMASLSHRLAIRYKYKGETHYSDAYEFAISGQAAKRFAMNIGHEWQQIGKVSFNVGWIDSKYLYMRIRKLEKKPCQDQLVHNIEVAEDESFTSSFAVHNSWDEAFAGIAKFIADNPEAKTRVYIHTYSEIPGGWPIPELVDQHGLTEYVTASSPYEWMNGMYGEDEMIKMFGLADVVLECGLEGFGIPTIEAQAMGTPVIGLNEGATPELLKYGVLVPVGSTIKTPDLLVKAFPSPESIATALYTVYTSPRSKWAGGPEWIRKNFDWQEVVLPKWIKLLKEFEDDLEARCVSSNYPPKPDPVLLQMAKKLKTYD